MEKLNPITLILVAVFFTPILIGMFRSFSRERVQYTFTSLFDNLEFLGGIILSVYLTKKVFFDNDSGVFKKIYELIPDSIKNMLYGKDVLTYVVVVPIVLLLVMFILRLLTNPIYNMIIGPMSDGIYRAFSSMNGVLKRMAGAASQLPKALYMVLVLGFILNFSTYYFQAPALGKWMNESAPYQVLYRNAISPALNSNIAKQIPVIVNDSFARTIGQVVPGENKGSGPYDMGQLAEKLSGGNIRVIEYFNGVTLDEAVKSAPEIDQMAKKIVGAEKDEKKKAYLLYKWVSSNIEYDYEKAKRISADTRGISSGAIVAFDTRKGICFDYSSLYVAMCRAVAVKVRIVTGLGYSGIAWGDHAWNQVFYEKENIWINVDPTFGSVGNYFDKPDFDVDHKYAEVQGEW